MKIALVFLALLLPSASFGMVFSWSDSAGIRHFTNREDEIPERYRARAKRLYPEQADIPAPQQNAQTQQNAKPEAQNQIQRNLPNDQVRIPRLPAASGEPREQAVRPDSVRKRRRGVSSGSSEE